jgi:hypothetical protein
MTHNCRASPAKGCIYVFCVCQSPLLLLLPLVLRCVLYVHTAAGAAVLRAAFHAVHAKMSQRHLHSVRMRKRQRTHAV